MLLRHIDYKKFDSDQRVGFAGTTATLYLCSARNTSRIPIALLQGMNRGKVTALTVKTFTSHDVVSMSATICSAPSNAGSTSAGKKRNFK